MSGPDAIIIEQARTELMAQDTLHRTITLWSTEWRAEVPRRVRHAAATGGAPVAALFEGSGYHRWYAAGMSQLPRILGVATHAASSVALPHTGADVQLQDVRTWLFGTPSGAVVLGLELHWSDARGVPVQPLPSLFVDLDQGRESLRIAGSSLLDGCCEGPAQLASHLYLGGDMHHVWSTPASALPETLAVDRARLMSMCSRRITPSRDDMLTASFPAEPNRYPHAQAAVTPGAAVLHNQEPSVRLAYIVSGVQGMAALSQLRQTHRRAHGALGSMRTPELNRPDWLVETTGELRDLELDLAFGVEAVLEVRLLVPSLPVEQLHATLVESLALSRGAAITATMLSRLAKALETEYQMIARRDADTAATAAADHETERAAERRRAAARRTAATAAVGVAGLVALPLTFLGINAREVNEQLSLFDRHYWPYFACIAAVVLLTIVGALQYARRDA